MKHVKTVVTLLTIAFLFSACSLMVNSTKYNDITQQFTDNMLNERYDKCLALFALDNPAFAHSNRDTLKTQLAGFREILNHNFGSKLDYTFIQSQKTYSTEKEESTPPNTTACLIQFTNDKYFGELQVLFDDKSNKIINIHTLDIKQPIPSMGTFWLFCMFPIAVFVFNIYAIVKVKRSGVSRKWLYYLGIVVLNIPTIGYTPVNGLFLHLFNFQILLGLSFQVMGYANSVWALGVPIGAIIALARIKNHNNEIAEAEDVYNEQPLTQTDRIAKFPLKLL